MTGAGQVSVVIVSRHERGLRQTLAALSAERRTVEIVVVDASAGALGDIARCFTGVRWVDFSPPAGARVTIAHQRNRGVAAAQGEIVVFIDAGCVPGEHWLERLTAPLRDGNESVTCGPARSASRGSDPYRLQVERVRAAEYVTEAPTINLAFCRSAFAAVGGFDESFAYGSDLDFTWRLIEHGHRIRVVPDAVVTADWGGRGRRLRRAYHYGHARARLYAKHSGRRRTLWRHDPLVVVYPLFLLALPLALRFRWYPILLALPAWRARHDDVAMVLADHLVFGVGVIAGAVALLRQPIGLT